MISVKSLVTRANPVPGTAPEGLSARAHEELASLLGTAPVQERAVRRRPRRGFLVTVVAGTAAAMVAGVALFAMEGPREPGGGDGRVADEPYFATTAELEGAAALVVRARLGAGREETTDGIRETVAPARVTATGKGDMSPGATIEVVYTAPGSRPETADLSEGHEYVLLLDKMDSGRYTLVNTTQGIYRVEDGHPVAGSDNDVSLSPGVLKALRLAS